MKEIKISKIEDVDVDYSSYDNVKIGKNSDVYVCIVRFLKFQFKEFLVEDMRTHIWHWDSGTGMFGYHNHLSVDKYTNRLMIPGKRTPLADPFHTPIDNCYNFPIKEIKKIFTERKERKRQDELNENANSFSFDIISSVILSELDNVGFKNVTRNKLEYLNNIAVFSNNQKKQLFTISENTLKKVIRKQQEIDETFPLILNIIGHTGSTMFKTNWGAIKKLLPGLLELKD